MASITYAWVDEPDGRGTWGLVQSCLVTLFLCVYTAIHLNIQPHQSKKKSWLRRIVASLLAAAGPEFMFVCAVSQWSLAKQLQLQLNHLEENVSKSSDTSQASPDPMALLIRRMLASAAGKMSRPKNHTTRMKRPRL